MRMISAAIRGGRPYTRFAVSGGHQRERQMGLRRPALTLRASSPEDRRGSSPLDELRTALRGAAGPVRPARAGLRPHGIRALVRSDSIRWSGRAAGAPHRARSRSAAPWRG